MKLQIFYCQVKLLEFWPLKVIVATARKNSGIYVMPKAGIMVEPGDNSAFTMPLKLSADEKLCSEMGSK